MSIRLKHPNLQLIRIEIPKPGGQSDSAKNRPRLLLRSLLLTYRLFGRFKPCVHDLKYHAEPKNQPAQSGANATGRKTPNDLKIFPQSVTEISPCDAATLRNLAPAC